MKFRTRTRWQIETPNREFVMITEAAQIVGVSTTAIREWVKRDLLKVAFYLGTGTHQHRVFWRADIESIKQERDSQLGAVQPKRT